jgi:hypothetical protein
MMAFVLRKLLQPFHGATWLSIHSTEAVSLATLLTAHVLAPAG